MTAPNQDWLEWLESLNSAKAEYIVVGGVSLAHHGMPRYTGDLDVLIHATPENARRVLAALAAFGFGSLAIEEHDLTAPARVIQLGYPPARIDLLTSIDGVTWDDADASAEAGRYGDVPTRFISRAMLIRNKRATGRTQDLADAERLEDGGDAG
jgi:hypothetical protein